MCTLLPINHAKGSTTIIKRFPSSARRRPDLPGAACLLSSADRCSVSSVWACVSVRGVVCLASGTACPAACAVQSVRVRWAGVSTSGVYGESRGWGWSTPRVEKIQKRRFSWVASQTTHPILTKRNVCHCAIFQIFRKIQKGPFPGLICAILDRKKGAL